MLRKVLIVLVVVAVLAFGIFFWPVPQIRQAAKDARSAEIVDPIVEALENPPTEASAKPVNPKAVVTIVSVMPGTVEAGGEIEITFSAAYADGTVEADYVFELLAPDKKEIVRNDIHPGIPFKMATSLTPGDNVVVGYIVAEHLQDTGMSSVHVTIQEDLTAPAVDTETQSETGCPARVTIEPPANAFVNADENKTYSFTFKLEEDRPYDIVVPCGSTATMAFGNATINDKVYVASDTEGNVVYSTCDKPLGCEYTVTDFTAGHAIVTMTYPGMEKALDTVYNAVSNMFNPSNCGGSGCLVAFMTDADNSETTATFKSQPAKTDLVVNDFVVEPTTGSVIGEPETKSITVDGKKVGQVYALESTAVQYIGVPEQHDSFVTGLYIECSGETGCNIFGTELEAGETAVVYANPGDENTPSDLNWTVAVQSDDPEQVTVWFIYADDVDNYATSPTYQFDSQGLIQ